MESVNNKENCSTYTVLSILYRLIGHMHEHMPCHRVRWKEVVTEQKNIEVPVTHEEVYVERRPASGPPADQPIGEQGEVYRIPVREEQVTVEKQPVEREEIVLGKRPVQETKQVSDTVRREEARVERSGDINVQGNKVEDTTDTTDQGKP
jgi:uncharacterized protein (TIGR02271 family)